MDAAGLQRYLLASVDRIEADDLTVLWQHQRRLVEVEQDRSAIDRRIIDLMRADEFRRLHTILESIPGVGLVVSATAIAEIGDFSRFPDSKAIGRYAGLTPTGYASADKNRLGRICKTGSPDLRHGPCSRLHGRPFAAIRTSRRPGSRSPRPQARRQPPWPSPARSSS